MKREDYLEIKEVFNTFIRAWGKADTNILDHCFTAECACHLSIVKKYPCGSQHGLIGIKDFIAKQPQPDFFYITPCNFVVRIKENEAQQSTILVCRCGVFENDNVRIIEFSALLSNHWTKTEGGWKIDDFKMDITECSGEYTEFIENWYFEKQDLAYYHGIHLPVISGELDAPWFRIPQEEDVKTDEERILEAFSRYAYGIDTLNFSLLTEALANDLVVNMAPWGAMDKREFMQTLKYKRQAVRYWNHPALLDCVLLHENSADLRLHRMAGHRQSAMPIIFTKENYDIQYADARYEIKMIKEDGIWKILRMDYFLGTIQLGKFSDLQ
ncbi:nuclear transport factor 2 family protein [Dysgonomonas capnocytophagoides]|uniref:nuclear transport factor 2 family protein n=1 Tax=Dysgonomonas capnocytophagoides TaxID=45254 RepID=UPI002A820F5A|nr:nuclear transport factor 2 family protein [Dysgonomonas capnocytophagoides]